MSRTANVIALMCWIILIGLRGRFSGSIIYSVDLVAHPYRQWIETYSGEDFGRLAGRLEALLDHVGADTSEIGDSYRHAMQCELDFFSNALRS